jgi:hypothetical protein
MPWVYDPHSGGVIIPAKNKALITAEVQAFERSRPWYPKYQLKLRFRAQFCYIDALKEGDSRPDPVCRLRYFSMTSWSLGFFTWSNDRYEPCAFPSGKLTGVLEDAISVCELQMF